jgi:N-acetylmuramoyl-L-alanine amidase
VSANGTEVYYCYGANSTDLANKVYKQMINEMPLTERGVKQNNYVVIRDTEMPAILCELAFISNYSDRMKLTDPECQAKWAKAICKGICAYYGVSYLELD